MAFPSVGLTAPAQGIFSPKCIFLFPPKKNITVLLQCGYSKAYGKHKTLFMNSDISKIREASLTSYSHSYAEIGC